MERRILVFIFLVVQALPSSAQPIRLSTADTSPYSRKDGRGYYDLLLEEAFHRIGEEIEILHLPSDRSLSDAVEGFTDGEFARIGGMEARYPSLIRVPEKLSDFTFTAFSLAQGIQLTGWESLSKYHVAYINGWKIFEQNAGVAKSVSIAPGEEELFSMLLAGRVDLILYSRKRGVDYLNRKGISRVFPVNPPLSVRPMYLYMHERRASLVDKLSRALRVIQGDSDS